MDWKDLIWHPLTGLAVGVSAIGQLGFGLLEPAWSLLSSTSGLWFPAIATTASTIMPELGYAQLGTKVLLASAILFVGVQVNKLIDKIQNWRENR
ncbi:hypothetical protein [Halomicrobium salinisoli]|uniref:hypothetical protein n=1 Tax=Halomicrobium salinisoli TaxID=2878391 RepID=UPI001CF05BD8|nr:hypothetical protein [Halomicrobium salinisoli]